MNFIRTHIWPDWQFVKASIAEQLRKARHSLPMLGEFALILVWAIWIGRVYLDFSPTVWPSGGEYPLSVRENIFWPNTLRCGACSLWNGLMNGGYPALVDLQGSPLHPLVAIPTLLFGIINGSKLTLLLGLALAGFAQWWIGRLLDLGWVARLWAALLAVTAGSITSRMENGLVTLVISTASAGLVIPAVLALWKKPSPRHAALLGVSLAMLAVAGQGYLQLAVVLGLFPALVILWIGERERNRLYIAHFLRAALLAALLSGIFLVPFLHQAGQMVKDVDPTMGNAQLLEYQPFNLLIRDSEFYRLDVLGKTPFPYLFFNYIGWVPILLAGLALRFVPQDKNRLLAFLLAAILLVYLNSSLVIPKLLFKQFFPDFLYGIRHPSLMTGLATPLILALSAWGLDLVWRRGPQLQLTWGKAQTSPIYLIQLLLIVPLVWALGSAAEASTPWLVASNVPSETTGILAKVRSTSARWVEFPLGELYWPLLAFDSDVKVSDAFHPWHFVDHDNPEASLVVERSDAPARDLPVVDSLDGMRVEENATVAYAAVHSQTGDPTTCQAKAIGGNIDVTCSSAEAGQLVVSEHAWSGWTARVDSKPVPLIPGQWLAVELPAGEHQIAFRYRPWDAVVGLLLSLAGVGMLIGLWRQRPAAG